MGMKKIYILLFLGLFLINLSSATLGTFGVDECVHIKTVLNTSAVNISSISFPNSSVATTNQGMTKTDKTFNYTFCETNTIGTYNYDYYDNEGNVYVNDFIITKTGNTLNISESIIYVLLTLAVLGLFLLSLFATITIPYSNEINERGAVIKVTKTKYVKLGLMLLSYVLFVWLLNVLIGVSDNYLSLTMYYGFVSFLFTVLNNLALPFSIFILILMFFEIIRDANIMEAISKFGSSK